MDYLLNVLKLQIYSFLIIIKMNNFLMKKLVYKFYNFYNFLFLKLIN